MNDKEKVRDWEYCEDENWLERYIPENLGANVIPLKNQIKPSHCCEENTQNKCDFLDECAKEGVSMTQQHIEKFFLGMGYELKQISEFLADESPE